MSTRSRIGIELQNGSVLSVYHHWDGYPEGLGKILTEHYTTKEKITELIDGGDMSHCWTKERWNDQPQKNYGPQYYSQRGEDCPPRLDADLNEYLCDGEEYAYLFTNGEWVCYNMHQFDDSKLPEIVAIPSPVAA